jgi:hypothetical protein
MGFQYWYQGILLVLCFLVIVGLPCFFVALFGTKMINDLGNFPTKSAQIQKTASWKILLVEIVCFVLLIGAFSFLYFLNQ